MQQFSELSREQVDEALAAVDVNSRSGLIFDLRGNPGGLLTSAVDIGSLFIEDDVLLYEVFADGSEEIFRSNGDYGNIEVPIVVLIDEGSASASELVSGAIKDYGVATLIGETTFGKGTVQNIQPLSNEGALRLTIARYLTPNRTWIHDVGVTPDIIIEWNPQTVDEINGPDPQLQAAIELLEGNQ
jgi:carboxyl-terminal processing protease